MISRYTGCALLTVFALGTTAHAQIYDNNEVIVNPEALLQLNRTDPNAPIHLHMPYRHRTAPHVAKAKPKTDVAVAKPSPSSPPLRTVEQQSAQQDMLSFGPVPGNNMFTAPALPSSKVTAPPKKPVPKTVEVQKSTPPKASPPATKTTVALAPIDNSAMSFMPSAVASVPTPARPSPSRTASVEPADLKGMSKRSTIPFPSGAEEPGPEVIDTIKNVSGDLNNSLGNGSARIELEAFGGKPNDKSSEARRLSLRRALIVRQLLIDEGVPSERIDVRAMGGASSGSADRVDIFVRA